jgi:hypothetical protein
MTNTHLPQIRRPSQMKKMINSSDDEDSGNWEADEEDKLVESLSEGEDMNDE